MTWLHRFFPDIFWNTYGGDFAGVPSAEQTVQTTGYHAWSSPGLVTDIQAWADDPSSNFGWVLIGDESSVGSMKWFATKQNSVPQQRPVLTVEYSTTVRAEQKTWGSIKALYK